MSFNENILFLRSFIQHPKRVGSVIPSSRFLADSMVKQAKWPEVKAVAELGSGTGAITRAISTKVNKTTKVLLFEMDETMRNKIKTEYPDFSCYPDASQLVETMKDLHVHQLDCIFSGLPFFNFELELRETLVEQIYQALKPGGLFVAFQYSLQMKKQLSEYFSIEKIELVPFNLPPAIVYVCRKKGTIRNK
ncbi:methyltransferase domain-containing protein [Paenibacillus sp. FSL F4-0236]|uniref:class I SAM-dependent methyltransferase n=1 Tax=Paenibacillus sp. FSL F4-0236 TaxID=2954731 RepID=UPI0030FC5512